MRARRPPGTDTHKHTHTHTHTRTDFWQLSEGKANPSFTGTTAHPWVQMATAPEGGEGSANIGTSRQHAPGDTGTDTDADTDRDTDADTKTDTNSPPQQTHQVIEKSS